MPLPTFVEMQPTLGQPLEELPTPIVVADLDVLDRNIETFRALADEHGVDICSHTKAHKTPAIARRQQDTFDGGLMCQKLSEAEVMVRNGLDDLLLVCPVVAEEKLERLLWVADRADRFATTVDGPGNIEPLQRAAERRDASLDVVLEIDVGLGRMGAAPGEDAVEAGAFIDAQPNLELAGLLGHDAHVTHDAETEAEFEEGCRRVATALETTVDGLEDRGIAVERVISGSTATAPFIARHDVITDLDPGRYVLNDAELLSNAVGIDVADCGATVLTTVISRPTEDRAIVDAGSKTVSYASSPDPVPTARDDVRFFGKSSEHGYVDVSDASEPVTVGDRLAFVVPNLYGAINLQDTLPGVRDGRVEELWHVEARGKDK